jgi:hypothetical protein
METGQARAFAAGALAAIVLCVAPLAALVLRERASSARHETVLEDEIKAIQASVAALEERTPVGRATIAESVDLRFVDAVIKACQARAPQAEAPARPAASAPVAEPVARTPEQDEALERAKDLVTAVLRRGEYSPEDAMAIRHQLEAANAPEAAHSLRGAIVGAFNEKKIATSGRFIIP